MYSKSIKQCQICNSKKINEILDLGYMPPVNNFLSFLKVKKQELFSLPNFLIVINVNFSVGQHSK